MEDYKKFIEMAIELGANDARIIKTDSIVTAAWVRWKCRYGCGVTAIAFVVQQTLLHTKIPWMSLTVINVHC